MANANVALNPWHPMTDPVDLKTLGKFAEELGECTAAVSRCIIQGINEAEPVTGVVNREWLENEIADVTAGAQLAAERFNLNEDRMRERMTQKKKRLREWHKMA